MSGISASEDCLAKYNLVKTKKHSYGIFCVEDTKVECKQLGDAFKCKEDEDVAKFEEEVYNKMYAYAEENLGSTAAYIVIDFKYITDRRQDKLVLISWCPESKLKVKAKMLHGSTLNALKQQFEGIQGQHIQAADFGELEYASVFDEVKR